MTLETDILQELERISSQTMNDGWRITKEAFGEADPEKRAQLTTEADRILSFCS